MRDVLRRARSRASLTDAELSRRVGLSRAAYTNIENGRKRPSLVIALRIARILNESVEQLFIDDVSSDEPTRESELCARCRGDPGTVRIVL